MLLRCQPTHISTHARRGTHVDVRGARHDEVLASSLILHDRTSRVPESVQLFRTRQTPGSAEEPCLQHPLTKPSRELQTREKWGFPFFRPDPWIWLTRSRNKTHNKILRKSPETRSVGSSLNRPTGLSLKFQAHSLAKCQHGQRMTSENNPKRESDNRFLKPYSSGHDIIVLGLGDSPLLLTNLSINTSRPFPTHLSDRKPEVHGDDGDDDDAITRIEHLHRDSVPP